MTGTNVPANSFVGAVTNTGPLFPATSSGSVSTGSFQLVGQDGSPVDPAGPLSSITLSAEGDPSDLAAGQTPDPLFNATLPTTGGGDTGSVLISPFIKPGTSTDTYYNHYSWLATMEDIFGVAGGHDHTPLLAGTGVRGLDGQGHLGFAAQPGLRAFGQDVFNCPSGSGQGGGNRLTSLTIPNGPGSGSPWMRMSLAVGTPVLALLVAGGYAWYLRRQARGPAGGTARAGMIPSPMTTALGRVPAITAGTRRGRPCRLLILFTVTLAVLAGCGTAASRPLRPRSAATPRSCRRTRSTTTATPC